MQGYKKKIERYNEMIEKNICKENVNKIVYKAKSCISYEERKIISYIEFIYQQSKFIQKRWWVLQGIMLLFLWFLLEDLGEEYYITRLLGIGTPLFVSLILPEMWKNRNYFSTEIENTSVYSLKKIYSARITLFSLMDIFLLTIFFLASKLSFQDFIIDFLIPFNVCCCINLRFLCMKKANMGYTMGAIVIWTVIWVALLLNNQIYQYVAFSSWMCIFLFSLFYLFYCIIKIQKEDLFIMEDILCN